MIDSLNAAQSGLQASKSVINNISNNIANENTEGYIKRVANLSELSYDDNSYANGVVLTSVERKTNEYLFEQIISQNSTESYYQSASDIYELAETIFTETDDSGLSKDLDNYFQAIEDLRSEPSSEIYQASLESKAEILVENMQSLYNSISELEESLETQLNDEVEKVNSLLSEIVYINDQIVQNGESLDLLDKRNLLEQELSSFVDIKVDTSNSDFYKLEIAGETAIFHNTLSYDLSVVDSSTYQKEVYDSSLLEDSSLSSAQEITIQLNNSSVITFYADTTGSSNSDVKQDIVDAINGDSYMKEYVTASLNDNDELVIESNTVGKDGSFDLELLIDTTKVSYNEDLYVAAENDLHIEVLDNELEFSSGSIKALTENLTTSNTLNVLNDYKNALDDIAYSLVNITSSYVSLDDDEYIYGEDLTQLYATQSDVNSINLFSGSSVMSMSFDSTQIDNLDQSDLEYLSTLQWKDDFNIDSSDSNSFQSFTEAIQKLRTDVASDKENIDFKLESAEAVKLSLQSTYEALTKVDNDEELINLMQYQAAYEANAKVITVVDEMLQTILAM